MVPRSSPAHRVMDAARVLDEGDDAEGRRTAPGRHAEIFRLEREGDLQRVDVEVAAEVAEEAFVGIEVGQRLEKAGRAIGGEAAVGHLQARGDPVELARLGLEEAQVARPVAREEALDLLAHPLAVGRRRKLGAVGEQQPIEGIEPPDVEVVVHAPAGEREDVLEQVAHHQEGRPDVEGEAVETERAVAATDVRVLLEDLDLVALAREDHAGREPPRAGTNDDHSPSRHDCLPELHRGSLPGAGMMPRARPPRASRRW
jgi:hypothetical protein